MHFLFSGITEWDEFGDSIYLVVSTAMTQPQAKEYCVLHGGILTSVLSQAENDYLQGKIGMIIIYYFHHL